jgi:hypothetical protein
MSSLGADQLILSQPGGRLSPPNNTGTPGFSDLPMEVYLSQTWFGLFADKIIKPKTLPIDCTL